MVPAASRNREIALLFKLLDCSPDGLLVHPEPAGDGVHSRFASSRFIIAVDAANKVGDTEDHRCEVAITSDMIEPLEFPKFGSRNGRLRRQVFTL